MPLTDADLDLVEVVIACCDGQMGRNAAREVISELDLAGFEIVRKVVDEQNARENLKVGQLPEGARRDIERSEMSPEHDHLNKLLDDEQNAPIRTEYGLCDRCNKYHDMIVTCGAKEGE